MIKEALLKELNALFSLSAGEKNIELIDLLARYEGNRLILKVMVDKPQGGITLGECALFNRQLGSLLEDKNIIADDYVLEVSSPGLDRLLKSRSDFLRSLNKKAVFFLNDLVNGKCQWQGIINKVDQNIVYLQVGEQILEIPLVKINKAQLVV